MIFPAAKNTAKFSPQMIKPIHTEVRSIESAIIDAMADGALEVLICDSLMTKGGDADCLAVRYWKVWRNRKDDRALEMHMDEVIKYFEGLGYSIVRRQNESNPQVFCWYLQW